MTISVGVIGVGYLGQHHARIFSELEGVELVGVSDIDVPRGEEIAQRYGCRFVPGHEELIGLCDALSIAATTPSHHRLAADCLRAKKDLFIEKPIAETVEEAREIVEMAARTERILQVGHLERYNPAVIEASRMIRAPRFVESERLSPFLGRGTDVDVTIDLMIHDIDIVMSIVNSKVRDIRAIGESVLSGKIDVVKAWIDFENGCAALITASRLAPEKVRKLRVYQKDAYLLIDYQNQEVRRYFKVGGEISMDVVKPGNREPLKEELRDFVDCVRERRKPPVSGSEALEALEIALRITSMLTRT